jgi:hypothetical protein
VLGKCSAPRQFAKGRMGHELIRQTLVSGVEKLADVMAFTRRNAAEAKNGYAIWRIVANNSL